jgi:hypothetical protein
MSSKQALLILAALACASCESPQAKAKDAEVARQVAEERVAQLTLATEQKEAEVQRRANLDISGIASVGERKIAETRMAADRREGEATEALWQARNQARAEATRRVDGADTDLAALRTKLESKLSMVEVTTVVRDVEAQTAAVRRSIRDLDQCTADDLDAIKASIDAGLRDVDLALDAATKRL